MKNKLLKRGLYGAAALGTAAGLLSFASPAQAVLTAPQTAVAAAGSDTTQNLMTAYMATQDNTTVNGHSIRAYNIKAQPNPAQVVPGDVNCAQGDITWNSGTPVGPFNSNTQNAPNGSGAGRAYLISEGATPSPAQGVGCIDIARSSGGPRVGTDPATFEYYAFGLDAVGWATPSMKAPGQLTNTQLKDIYLCNVTDWSAVGGTPGPIQRYLPQTGSGTRDFFVGTVLGQATNFSFPSSPTCPAVKASVLDNLGNPIPFEENQGKTIEVDDIDKAILPYSGGAWSSHFANRLNPTLDNRNGVRMGGLTQDTAPNTKGLAVEWSPLDVAYQLNTSGVVVEANTPEVQPVAANRYPGVRYVFNVIDSAITSTYTEARNVIGFDNTAAGFKSKMCTAGPTGARSLISTFGFAPLANAQPVAGTNLAGSVCRKYHA